MNTATPPTPPAVPAAPTPPTGRSPRRGRTVATAGVIAIAAVTVAVLVSGQGSSPDPGPAAAVSPYDGYTGSATRPFVPADVADGCLGGAGPEAGALGNPDLSQVVLAAQKAAPLTAKGAAEFTAALLRWSTESPLPPAKAATARQVLAPNATALARKYVAIPATKGTTTRIDFNDGRYNVDSFAAERAVISWVAVGHVTYDGTALQDGTLGGKVTLTAVKGVWRLQDTAAPGSMTGDLGRIVTPYTGGC